MTQLDSTINLVVDGNTLNQEVFDSIPARVKKKYDQSRVTVRAAIDKAGKEVNDLDARTLEELKKLRDDSVRYAIGGLMTNLVARYDGLPDVVQHLNELRDDIMDNTELFTPVGAEVKPDSEQQHTFETTLP